MVKKKSLDSKPEEKEILDQQIDEEDEIIELEEVVEEPEELPVGEELDELLFSETDDTDINDFDIESLDATLGLDESEEAKPEAAEETQTGELTSPTQEDIDALLKEESLTEEITEEEPDKADTATEKASAVSEPVEIENIDEILSELENRIVQKIEELIEQKVPQLVLKTVREELESIQEEFEENKK